MDYACIDYVALELLTWQSINPQGWCGKTPKTVVRYGSVVIHIYFESRHLKEYYFVFPDLSPLMKKTWAEFPKFWQFTGADAPLTLLGILRNLLGKIPAIWGIRHKQWGDDGYDDYYIDMNWHIARIQNV